MRKPNSIIVLLFIQNIWPILVPVSGYKNWMIFLADIFQNVGNMHRANVLRILAKPFFSLLQAAWPGKEVDRLSIACNFVSIQIIILSINLISKSICNGNRTECSPVRSVIIRVINKIGRPLSGSSICLTRSTITDRIGHCTVMGGSEGEGDLVLIQTFFALL